MGGEDLRDGHSPETSGSETGQRVGSGVGALLRTEREKQGLTCEDIADATKLRRHFIEAMEEEQWGELPPSVFVKGFITSYARTLNLDAREILDLYERDAPAESDDHRFYAEPKKGKRWWIFIVLILLACAGLAYYLWKGYPDRKEAAAPVKAPAPIVKNEQNSPPPREKPSEVEEEKVQPVEAKPEPPPPVEVQENLGESVTPVEEITDDSPLGVAEVQREPLTDRIVLRADILRRTWIRICVDDEGAKEYVFQPGSRPQWEAEKGFYVIVGNAAGVEFEFNEKILKNLGAAGQVVRLTLPEDFKPTHCEE